MQDLQTSISVKDGEMTVQRTQDCTPIAEHAQAMHNEGLTGSKDMKLAASLPLVMVEKYCNDNGIFVSEFMQDREHIRRMLNDPALAHFRIWKGRI